VPTEFAERAGVKGKMAPGLLVQTAESVAAAGYRGLMRGRRTVVPGLGNKLVTLAVRFVPRRRLLRAVGARQSRRQAAPQA
jgi:short-subunit dehydrogenase